LFFMKICFAKIFFFFIIHKIFKKILTFATDIFVN